MDTRTIRGGNNNSDLSYGIFQVQLDLAQEKVICGRLITMFRVVSSVERWNGGSVLVLGGAVEHSFPDPISFSG